VEKADRRRDGKEGRRVTMASRRRDGEGGRQAAALGHDGDVGQWAPRRRGECRGDPAERDHRVVVSFVF
jgi:hypothetical protein